MADVPQPNIDNMNAAITGMAADGAAIAKGAQSFANHQQAFSNEVILAANYPVGQMQQQLAQILQQLGQIQQQIQQQQIQQQNQQQIQQQIQQQLTAIQADTRELRELTSARDFNNHARFSHAKVFRATDSLITMHSVDTTANAPVQLNTPIPNFPATADAVTQLTVNQCRDILTALQEPIPAMNHARTLRTAVRQAIGLAAL